MQVRAAVVRSTGGPFELQDLVIESPRADEVLVRIAGAGVCHTDLVCRDQYFPVPLPCVFGHEGSGTVERVGSAVTSLAPGDPVVLSFSSCQRCDNCLAGKPGYCLELYQHNFAGARPDGSSCLSQGTHAVHGHFFSQSSFATYALARERNTIKVPAGLPLAKLGPLGCGVQTGAGAVLNSLRPSAGSNLAVFGCGTVGLSAVMAARLCGCLKVIAVDINPARRALALELGATHSLDPTDGNIVERIQELTGTGCHYTLECTGLPTVVRQAVESLTLTGICGVIGVSRLGTEIHLDMNSILFGRGVRGIIEGDSVPQEFIPRLLGLYQQGRFPFDRLIAEYPFERIQDAVSASERGEVVKAVVVMA